MADSLHRDPIYRSELLRALAAAVRARHFSPRTEQAYVHWVRRYVRHHRMQHPRELGAGHVNAFLTSLAVEGKVAASTQSQARAALLFLYREVLGTRLDADQGEDRIIRARKPRRLPAVLSRDEVRAVLARMVPPARTVALLLYGAGLRLNEALRLRVRDLDDATGQLTVRSGKGDRDRISLFPATARDPLQEQLARVRRLHARDLDRGAGCVPLPAALARKYPAASREWGWQWVFPASRIQTDPETGTRFRWPLHPSACGRAGRPGHGSHGATVRPAAPCSIPARIAEHLGTPPRQPKRPTSALRNQHCRSTLGRRAVPLQNSPGAVQPAEWDCRVC